MVAGGRVRGVWPENAPAYGYGSVNIGEAVADGTADMVTITTVPTTPATAITAMTGKVAAIVVADTEAEEVTS